MPKAEDIKKILYGYIACDSISSTEKEQKAENYFLDFFKDQPYFKAHPDHFGAEPIHDDPCGRSTVWAMVKGTGKDAVVCIHHHDVVTVEDFKSLKDLAFSPDELEEALAEISDSFSDEAREDYESGGWIFGRGGCDMKGGGSIQMALLSEYGRQIMEDPASFKGHVIILSVPDEENLSAGMLTGIKVLKRLKEKYDLNYRLMINSEPHQRKEKNTGIFSFGSIGKIMPYVYVRGCLAHAGKVFEGLNPAHVMAGIVRKTEVNMDFSDIIGNEAAPPPTWLYLRENKENYDVSMPLTINGCLSVLTLNSQPRDVLYKLKDVCIEAFDEVIEDMNRQYARFMEATHREPHKLPWKTHVVLFGDLIKEARRDYPDTFDQAYKEELIRLKASIRAGEESTIMANFKLVDFVYDYINDLSPRVVVGLMPPYYPNVYNGLNEQEEKVQGLYEYLRDFTEETFGQTYVSEAYYTGISDLSYSYMKNADQVEAILDHSMAFFGDIYHIPLKDIEAVSMPCVNVGPWGKDFHKLTERVYKEDMYERTPVILNETIRYMLND
ncbi:MAG: M20/M25/M40 family metallo-hydrolase [Lachnospiraceae bacterium]|nr:M20/M25/M40 family metallo-hydrolase [Candidatus Equihabitans merdae]